MLIRLDGLLKRIGSQWTVVLSLAFVLLLGWLDNTTGFELSFSVFYLVPIALTAWYSPNLACYWMSLLSAWVWHLSNEFAGQTYSHIFFPVWNAFVRLIFFCVVCTILRQLHELLRREQYMSRRDHLTGLFNLRAFEDALEKEHARAVRRKEPLAVGFIDLDNFKKVNDRWGHAEGDRVLTKVAQTLQSNLRKSDTIGRVGGDEFVVMLPQTGQSESERVAQKVVECLRVLSEGEGWPISASLGVVVCQTARKDDDLQEILKCCDQLMYKVKDQGKNSFRVEILEPGEG